MSKALASDSYAMRRAAEIHKHLQVREQIQVRWCLGHFYTFKHPAPRGYGLRGEFVAVYSRGVPLDWIETDLCEFEHKEQHACTARP